MKVPVRWLQPKPGTDSPAGVIGVSAIGSVAWFSSAADAGADHAMLGQQRRADAGSVRLRFGCRSHRAELHQGAPPVKTSFLLLSSQSDQNVLTWNPLKVTLGTLNMTSCLIALSFSVTYTKQPLRYRVCMCVRVHVCTCILALSNNRCRADLRGFLETQICQDEAGKRKSSSLGKCNI